MANSKHETDVVIIGAGPVGLFTVFELGMLKIKCHVIDALDFVGGQCTAMYPEKPIYDIPGYPKIDAAELIKKLEEQAAPFKPVYHLGQQVIKINNKVSGVGCRVSKNTETRNPLPETRFTIETSKGTQINCGAIIIAAGGGAFGPNRPPISGLEEFEKSKAVQYMVKSKEEFRGKKIVIAGGGDSAIDWTISLAPLAEKIYLVHRRDKFRAAPENIDQVKALVQTGKVEMVIPYQLDGLKGNNGKLESVIVKDLDNKTRDLPADNLLPFYGLAMDLGPIASWGLQSEKNLLSVNPATLQTNEKGIYAIGDINTYPGKLKLILCGFSEAAMAAHAIRAYLRPDEAFNFEYSTTKGIN